MEIKPTYVTFEQTKSLKEKGFDEECKMCVAEGDERPLPFNCGNTIHKNSLHPYYSAPEQWQVVEWLRVEKGIWVEVKSPDSKDVGYYISIHKPYRFGNHYNGKEIFYGSPQEAYSAAFDYVLNNNLI
jgi:hypothetical protein